MSKYTTEVRYICEMLAGEDESKGYNDVDEIVALAEGDIFDEYPIFDESYRSALNIKILRHFYTREICAETFGLWKLWLNNKMNEIMPYYNQLYKSALLEFDPFTDTNLTTAHTGSKNIDNEKSSSEILSGDLKVNESGSETGGGSKTGNGSTTTSASQNNTLSSTEIGSEKNVEKMSDTPQGALNNLENNDYLTEATINENGTSNATNEESSGSSSSSATSNTSETTSNNKTTSRNTASSSANTNNANSEEKIKSTEDYIETICGKRSMYDYSTLLEKFRKTFLNIDLMIIKELDSLFLHIW